MGFSVRRQMQYQRDLSLKHSKKKKSLLGKRGGGWEDGEEGSCRVPALHDTLGVVKRGHSCWRALILSRGIREPRSAVAEPCSPSHMLSLSPSLPGETSLTAAQRQTACVPEFMMATYRRPFTLKVILSFPSLAECAASVNPLTFRADTYPGWLSARPEPWQSLTQRWPQHSPASAPSHNQPPSNVTLHTNVEG